MGRGHQEGSSLLYGAIARRSSANSGAIEAEFQRLLGLDGGEARHELLEFVRANRIGMNPGGGADDLLDEYALWLEKRLEVASPHFRAVKIEPPSADAGEELLSFLDESRTVLARIGHRMDDECLETLLDTHLSADLWNGPGFQALHDCIERLMAAPRLEVPSRELVWMKRDGSGATHNRHANPSRFVACDRERVLDDSWELHHLGGIKVTCKRCRKSRASIALHIETSTDKIERMHYGLVERSTTLLLKSLRPRLPMDPDEFSFMIRGTAWFALTEVLQETYQRNGRLMTDPQLSAVERLWIDPDAKPPADLPRLETF